MKKLIIIICSLFVFQSCAPFLGALGVVSLGAHSKQKGIGTTINDNIIKTRISNFIFKLDEDLIPILRFLLIMGLFYLRAKLRFLKIKLRLQS